MSLPLPVEPDHEARLGLGGGRVSSSLVRSLIPWVALADRLQDLCALVPALVRSLIPWVALGLLASGCGLGVWPEHRVTGRISRRLPGTLFMEPIPATSPCAADVMAVAMGVSRRGYYVMALPPGVGDAAVVRVRCETRRDDVELWAGSASAKGSCKATRVLHLRLEVTVLPPGTKHPAGPLVFEGRQRLFPGPLDQGCRYDIEPERALRKRAGEAIGWRLPPGPVEAPGVDPRIIVDTGDRP